MRVALLRNAKSAGNLNKPAPTLSEKIVVVDLLKEGPITEILNDLLDAPLDVLVIDGGDGTVRSILSELPEIFTEQMPVIGVLPHGNTNLIAKRLGSLKNYETLEKILAMSSKTLKPHLVEASVLRLDFTTPDRPSIRGFIMGWGAYAAATKIAIEEVAARGGKQVIKTFFKTLSRSLFGPDAKGLRQGVRGRFKAAGFSFVNGARFLGIATTLPGPLVAGLKPFWGDGHGVIRWLDVKAPAKWLVFAVPFVAFGKPMGWMKKAGYLSGRSDRIDLEIDGGIVVDGDFFKTEASEVISITGAETFEFLTL